MLREKANTQCSETPSRSRNWRPKVRKLERLVLLHFYVLALVGTAWADDAGQPKTLGTLPWWQTLSGIIGILVAILGGYLTYLQIKKIRLERKKNDKSGGINVANEAIIEGSTVGDITGIKSVGSGTPPELDQNIEVLNKGRVRNSDVGDIAGIKQQSGSPKG